MTDPVFQQAFDAVRKSWSDAAWSALTPRQISEAIYQEIRRIDALAAEDGCRPRDTLARDTPARDTHEAPP